MKKILGLITILTVVTALLILGCAPTKPGTAPTGKMTPKTVGEKTAQMVTPTASTEKSVSTVESDIAGIDTLDQDLDTGDLDSLDKDLHYEI